MATFVSNLPNDDEVSDTIFMDRMRYWRDTELYSTDWTQVPDSPVDKPSWATYRQELRDMPESNPNVREIQVPVPPST